MCVLRTAHYTQSDPTWYLWVRMVGSDSVLCKYARMCVNIYVCRENTCVITVHLCEYCVLRVNTVHFTQSDPTEYMRVRV